MSFLDRLRAEFSEKRTPSELTKLTQAPSVGFVSIPGKHISEIEGAGDAFFEDARLDDSACEARRQRVLAMLEQNPVIRYAVIADAESDSHEVIVTLAIRDFAACELRIPRDKYRPFELLRLIEQHGGTVH